MPRRNADTIPVPARWVPVQRLPDERVPHGDGLARAARRLFEWACLAVANIVSWNTLLLPGSRATRARKCGVSR
jgi:hypothetical protein